MNKLILDIDNWSILTEDQKIDTLKLIGYGTINDKVISYKSIREDGYDMGKTYCYNQVGKVYIDEYYSEKDFQDPYPHTPGGIWSTYFAHQYKMYPENKNNLMNHYVKISSDIQDVHLCYDCAIKSKKVCLLEIQGTDLHL